jgi:hypothetical protein
MSPPTPQNLETLAEHLYRALLNYGSCTCGWYKVPLAGGGSERLTRQCGFCAALREWEASPFYKTVQAETA